MRFDTKEEVFLFMEQNNFTEFPVPQFNDYADYFFQRRFIDRTKTTFFLDAYVYHFCSTTRDTYDVEFSCQVYESGTHNAINMTFLYWDLDKVVDFVDKMRTNNLVEDYDNED